MISVEDLKQKCKIPPNLKIVLDPDFQRIFKPPREISVQIDHRFCMKVNFIDFFFKQKFYEILELFFTRFSQDSLNEYT